MSGTSDNYGMPLPPFTTWIQKQEIKPLEADRLIPIIANAGPRGITRGEIGKAIRLERDAIDELLDGLVRFGLLTVADENGLRVYRAV